MRTDLFKESNKRYKALLVKLKGQRKGTVKHKNPVSKEYMGKILDSPDITISEGLQNRVFTYIMIYFANRGREYLRIMSISDFAVQKNEQNLRYIIRHDSLTNRDVKMRMRLIAAGRMYEIPGSSRCPVTSFLALKEVLNTAEQCM
ncbi:hypothetical protein HOLleu_39803 [Holothuria leucospilota]|uniref:Uncharacterized protein n=1 Tax=Holothuria leucospilota TaxID=206669 RepID=A0A9Q1BB74_HOLLE|nr:hypothetical protein HOLleu_39803 [Holothuria leucospilota]